MKVAVWLLDKLSFIALTLFYLLVMAKFTGDELSLDIYYK